MKLLITGGNGFLGSRIISFFSNSNHCLAPSHQELDITNLKQCQNILYKWQPDIVIHTAAISDVSYCESHPDLSNAINVNGSVNLAYICKELKIPMLFMSSDQVYSSNHTALPNNESDPCHPLTLYGRQKLEAEQRILDLLPDQGICLRLSWMYDHSASPFKTKSNFLTQLMNANEQSPVFFSDLEYRGITWVWEVIQNLSTASSLPAGIYNFGSYATTTTYQLAAEMLEILKKKDNGMPILQKRTNVSPRSLSMSQDKLQAHHISFSENLTGLQSCLTHYSNNCMN